MFVAYAVAYRATHEGAIMQGKAIGTWTIEHNEEERAVERNDPGERGILLEINGRIVTVSKITSAWTDYIWPDEAIDLGFAYLIKAENGLVKIGQTSDLRSRFLTLYTVIPVEIEIVAYCQCENYEQLERQLHQKYANVRVKGEWFALSDKEVSAIITEYGFSLMVADGRRKPTSYDWRPEVYWC